MVSKFRTWWQFKALPHILIWWKYTALSFIREHRIVAIMIAPVAVLILFVFLAYRFGWDWTGFNSGTSQITISSSSKGNYTVIASQPGKALWDWLNLLGVLAIPAAVGLGTIWFTRQQTKVSDAENKDNQREAALQAYIDKMSELLLEKKLRESVEGDEVRNIARVRTLTVLRGLDAIRKASVLQFLHESGLIDKNNPIIILNDANFTGAELLEADLRGADLSNTLLSGAFLHTANLSGANLSGAILVRANLAIANLGGADLSGAVLEGANLNYANLSNANFVGADLRWASLLSTGGITTEELEKQTNALMDATMPDGSKHP